MSAPTTSFSPTPEGLVDYARSLDCIHCGLCLQTCPTYQLSARESSSPRGRIHLMRALAEGRLEADEAFRDEMDFCLVCRHCESVCPAGVEFGAMMEHTRDGLQGELGSSPSVRFLRWLGFRVTLPSRFLLSLAITGLAVGQRLGLVRLVGRAFGARGAALAALPPVPPRRERRPLPEVTSADGERTERVAMLAGCVMPELFGRVNRATARTLACAGAEVHTAPRHVCCGALHAHNGDLARARALARTTIEAFEPLEGPIVVNSAGCAAHMKEYPRVLADDADYVGRAQAFARRVVDYAEFLGRPDRLERVAQKLSDPGLGRVTWDDPCHLCHGQGVRSEPRALLDAIPGIERIELDRSESCCGSAGIYSILRPADSAAILDAKLADLDATGAETLVTANPGCQLQWTVGVGRGGRSVEVLHLAEVLERALSCSE